MENVFQVERSEAFLNGQCLVDGRFIAGRILRIGDTFVCIQQESLTQTIACRITDIQMYNQSVSEIDIGMTARLVLNTVIENVGNRPFELISSDKGL